jgi:hypothetical protein
MASWCPSFRGQGSPHSIPPTRWRFVCASAAVGRVMPPILHLTLYHRCCSSSFIPSYSAAWLARWPSCKSSTRARAADVLRRVTDARIAGTNSLAKTPIARICTRFRFVVACCSVVAASPQLCFLFCDESRSSSCAFAFCLVDDFAAVPSQALAVSAKDTRIHFAPHSHALFSY